MKIDSGRLVYSPSDLVRYLESPFSSWMDRFHLENPGVFTPDELSEDAMLVIETGNQHEANILQELTGSGRGLRSVERNAEAVDVTRRAFADRVPIIYQAKLEAGDFAGFADFIMLDEQTGRYKIWDTKLARSPKPYYAIQLCCYSEMFAEMFEEPMPESFGIILGADAKGVCERIELRVEDFIHYYRYLKASFLEMMATFDGDLNNRPIPDPRADHSHWQTQADAYLDERDHLVRVAGITSGHIKKLESEGIATLADLAAAGGRTVPKIMPAMMEKLVHQARLQKETRDLRATDKKAPARFDLLPTTDEHGKPVGLAALPPEHPMDVYFDIEGYPLMPGGLEYLLGNTTIDPGTGEYEFTDFWAHDRAGEKRAFEQFVDWVYDRWKKNPGMHIYHYASYERTALQNLSTRHDTRQEEVDNILRNDVLVDLYKVVRRGLRIGEESYSLKKVERLYWPDSRTGLVTMSIGSIVHYARWMQSGEPEDWTQSPILKEIRDYNKDDCDSTAELAKWLRKLAAENGIPPLTADDQAPAEEIEIRPEFAEREALVERLRERKDDPVATVLADLVNFHRREEKPVWWKFFERLASEPEVLRDDNGCIAEVEAFGDPVPEKRSLLQGYEFDAAQECKVAGGDRRFVYFTHIPEAAINLFEIDLAAGKLKLKAGQGLMAKLGGSFPERGSLVPNEVIPAKPIPEALSDVSGSYLSGGLNSAARALLERRSPKGLDRQDASTPADLAISVARRMDGDCFVVQGPPGTGKTYTASHMIAALLADGKKIGITSNGHKAIVNLMQACGRVMREQGRDLVGIKVGDESEGDLFDANPNVAHAKDSAAAADIYSEGVLGGTAWVFSNQAFAGEFDYLFVDEAGQVPLANVIAMTRSTKNLVLLGDQMQLEQPIQGKHPGDSRLSALQYALKDTDKCSQDINVFHAVVPSDYGLFLGESRRMHPSVCAFISESVYEGRLNSFADCAKQKIAVPDGAGIVAREHGIAFYGVEHDGNVQNSSEEVEQVLRIYEDLIGREFTDSKGVTRTLKLSDFLFISPYNAQVRDLTAALPSGERVGSVDKFQGQEAPVCILSLCSSFGEYGSRGLGFILDQNRINVAISRAQCLAVVVGDPRIAGSPAASLDQMKLLNLFCKLRTTAKG